METKSVIGIDPDSLGFVCSMLKLNKMNFVHKKEYSTSSEGIANFIKWAKKQGECIIGIEGSNGQSRPIEQALRKLGITFYSFNAKDVANFRKTVLGENKNNEKDAEAVARYALALKSQGMLSNYQRVHMPDDQLQPLIRSYEQKSKMITKEINSLWKLIRNISTDLYLTLGGNNPDVDIKNNILSNHSILSLLSQKPDIFEWKKLSEEDFICAMGSYKYKGYKNHIHAFQKIAKTFQPISHAMILMLENSAQQILFLRKQVNEIIKLLKKITEKNQSVKSLEEYNGISTLTASNLIAEIIDIRRFAKDDNLASYAGLTKKEYSTGKSEAMRYNANFNRRLKDALMTAARNFVIYNPDSHLTGYYKNLVKKGLSKTEAQKRVARALVRVIFKKLYSLVEETD